MKLLLASAIGILGTFSLAWADIDPDEAQAYQEAVAAQEQAPASGPLGQFGQPEMAAVAPVTPKNAPSVSTVTPASASRTAADKKTGLDFPKVQTPEDEVLAKRFQWWPTEAQPSPVKDPARSGYWWWPNEPRDAKLEDLWGNQGFVYVKKIIFDYKETAGPMKPSLVIKRVLRNVKVYFDYDKSELRDDTVKVLDKALYTLGANPKADILITGNADVRGSEQYNQRLGERRAAAVEDYLVRNGLPEDRIRILSRGKMDAMAPSNDIVGMQKDRNAQFMIAEVEEVMIPADKAPLYEGKKEIEEEEEVEGEIRVDTKDYIIKSGDTLWGIAEREYGDGRQWKRIYEFNKDVISNPNKPRKGTKIQIPIE